MAGFLNAADLEHIGSFDTVPTPSVRQSSSSKVPTLDRFTTSKSCGNKMSTGTPRKRQNTPKFGTPILAGFGSENTHPNTPGDKNLAVGSTKKKTPLRRASSSNSLFGTPGSKTPNGSLPLIEGGFSSKRKSSKKYERPFTSPEGSKRSPLSGLETIEHYGLQDDDINSRINLLGIKDLNANGAETEFFDPKTVTPIPCKPKQSRRRGSFATLNTCSPDVDDTFSPVTKQMYAREKDTNKPLKGAMKKTNIQRVINCDIIPFRIFLLFLFILKSFIVNTTIKGM